MLHWTKMTSVIGSFFMLYVLGISSPCAQVFSCRNTNGEIIFAKICPRGTTQVKRVIVFESKVKHIAPLPQKSLAELDQEYKERQLRKEDEAAKERDRQRRIEWQCEDDKRRMQDLLNGSPLKIGEDELGNPIFMEDEEREETIKVLAEKLTSCR